MSRVYLDWNATTPLCAEARAAMIAAMDVVGNPSSVHAEGRAAKKIIEAARADLAEAFGAAAADIIFTSSASEAAALALNGQGVSCSGIEHDCIRAWCEEDLDVNEGLVAPSNPGQSTLQAANSETGVIQELPEGLFLIDFVQAFGKRPIAFDWSGAARGILSAHKISGPKGVGALVVRQGVEIKPQLRGGGQEMNRRAGTENAIGIAGFAAAAKAAMTALGDGASDAIAAKRDALEARLLANAPRAIVIGAKVARLANTSAIAVPGWRGETQVMQMDLAGFAISAGSACSSGKVRESHVLRSMGYDELTSASAIRVSIGATTTQSELDAFGDAWLRSYEKFEKRAA